MKSFFKFCIPKILFLLLVTNSEMQPAAMVPTLMATEELTVLAAMGAAAIYEMLIQYSQRDKSEDEILPANIPGVNFSIQSVPDYVANDQECYFGPDKHGNHCYAKILEDGRQVCMEVQDNKIKNWGINKPKDIRVYNTETGFKALKVPS